MSSLPTAAQIWAYHVTTREALPNITKQGLLPQEHSSLKEPGIFFEPDEEEAAIYHEPGKTVMLRFPLKHTPTYATEDGEYVHFDPVPPEQLEIRKKRWLETFGI